MEASFWHEKWESGILGFHQSDGNPWLREHIANLNLPRGARIFLPLCGKTRDAAWLLGCGYLVVGAELSPLAIGALFHELAIQPTESTVGELTLYGAPNIQIFGGDFFALDAHLLGPVDAVYDRAALVALPASQRQRYASHLIQITAAAPQLLITYEYDPEQMEGPPFSVLPDEVRQHYGTVYQLHPLACQESEFNAARETIWWLQ